MKDDCRIDYSRVLNVLTRHVGAENGISGEALARAAGCAVRLLRTQITHLRLDGVAVCGTPETGYFIASSAQELNDTCDFLEGRGLSSLLLSSRMKKIPMADLLGQLKLPT